nr:MAG: ORF1 [TTV-like mini virus]
MPWYGRRRWYRPRRRRRFRFRSRFRKTFRNRRYQRRRRVRKKHYRKRKLKKIIVREFQPQTIKKCKIKGLECAFLCNFQKIYFNYQLYEPSIVPQHLPGGGGWSVKAFSLNYLYDAHQHCKNIWTKGNYNLPLVKYLGCRIRCYQSLTQDWVFRYQNFYPMVATIDSYCSAQPGLMLMNHHTKKIPSKITYKKKKPYITFRIKPPALMQNKWYFAHDLSKIPLLMTYCSACSLDNYYIETDKESTNITINILKTGIFENTNFENKGTTPYWCRQLPNSPFSKLYLYATQHEFTGNKIKVKYIICLGDTQHYTGGFAFADPHNPYKDWTTYKTKHDTWGNPFYPDYLNNKDTYTIWLSTINWATIINTTDPETEHDFSTSKTPVTELYEQVRYAPERDTGDHNTIYFTSTTIDVNHWDPPTDTSYTNHGFPLYILFWGWTDWIKKTKIIPNLNRNGIVVFNTDQFDIQLPLYIPLDLDYIEGYDPYQQHDADGLHRLPSSDNQCNWFPQLTFQDQTIEKICMSGPGCPRLSNKQYIQAMVKYKFHFTWGGCPKTLEKACNPCSQPTWTTPDNMHGRLEIQNPNTNPLTELYKWDWDGDYVTAKAIQRIQTHTTTDKSSFISTANKNTSQAAIQKKQEKTQEEEEKTLLNQLQLLQQQRQQLQSLLLNRITTR